MFMPMMTAAARTAERRFVQLIGGPALDAALVNRSFRAEIAAASATAAICAVESPGALCGR
jgi:hypothetical protein